MEDIRNKSPRELSEFSFSEKEIDYNIWEELSEEGELVYDAKIGIRSPTSDWHEQPSVKVHRISPEVFTIISEDATGSYPTLVTVGENSAKHSAENALIYYRQNISKDKGDLDFVERKNSMNFNINPFS